MIALEHGIGFLIDLALVFVFQLIRDQAAPLYSPFDIGQAVPELDGAENKKIMKLKTVDAIIDYAKHLFGLGR